ncbi:MAG: hypothetical protein NTY36_08015 [Deltaproteobacteria bacterium]|nr:hypothetical protein [Deltaproteobacteria bacterium]
MKELLISIAGMIVGVAATVLVAYYYFRRSVTKSLTPYIQFSSSPLNDIDPGVRKEIEVKYQEHTVESLYEIKFLIANTGDKSISDVVEPLSLKIPTNCTLLDAALLHVSPEGRKVILEISHDKYDVKFNFILLNRGEFFIAKLLLNGSPSEKYFKFAIVAEELPPFLYPIQLPNDAIATSKKQEFEFGVLIGGLLLTLFALSMIKVIYDRWSSLPAFQEIGIWNFIINLGISGWALIFSTIPSFLLLLIGVMMTFASFTEGNFPPRKKKFIVPDDKQLLRRTWFRMPIDVERIE